MISADELQRAQAIQGKELSDEELAGVAGGGLERTNNSLCIDWYC
jgi:bacteriocin-like protein